MDFAMWSRVLVVSAILGATAQANAQSISQPSGATGGVQVNYSVGQTCQGIAQSFTATATTVVTAINVRSVQDGGAATLNLYNGVFADGATPAYVQPAVSLPASPGGAASGWTPISLTTPFPVTAGQQYTFKLDVNPTPGSNVTLAFDETNPYPGGIVLACSPIPEWDLAFQVFEQGAGASAAPVSVPSLTGWALLLLAGGLGWLGRRQMAARRV